jgi:hypothetical protein
MITMGSDDRFRIEITEYWKSGEGSVLFIGLNPSTKFSGGLVTRCINLAKDWGYCSVHIMNLFPYRTPDPSALFRFYKDTKEISLRNDTEIRRVASEVKLIVACWGDLGTFKNQDRRIKMFLWLDKHQIHHLGLTKQGNPRHAAYVERGVKPILWNPLEINSNG